MALLGIYFFILIVIFYIAAHFWLKWRDYWRKFSKIPCPRTKPFIGHVLYALVHKDPARGWAILSRLFFLYPKIICVWVSSFIPVIMIYRPEDVEVILGSNKHLNKGRMYKLLEPYLGQGLVTSKREKWRPRRKLLTPTMHYDILKDFVEIFNQQSKILVQQLKEKAENGQEIELYPYIKLCTLDMICESAMGTQIHAQLDKVSPFATALYTVLDIIAERQMRPWVHPDLLFHLLGRGREFDKNLDFVHKFTKKVIMEKYAEIQEMGGVENLQKRRLAFLDLLLDMVHKGAMPMDEVQEEVDTFMFAGYDTTATSMSWFTHLIGSNPEIQSKLHEEIDSVFGDEDKDLTYEDLTRLPYLECCIKETLRLFPVFPLITRFLAEDEILGGHKIPAGVEVVIAPYMLHRHPEYWPDAEAFKPERFFPENAMGRHPFAYVPFSAGSRNCLGQRFAMMEAKTVLAWMLHHYRIQSIPMREEIHSKFEVVLGHAEPITYYFTPRR